MTNYQESLNFIIRNSCPSKKSCDECGIASTCNCDAKYHIDKLQELIDIHYHNICRNCIHSHSACDDEDGYSCDCVYHNPEFLEFSGDYCSHFEDKNNE